MADSPLSESQFLELAHCARHARRLRRAIAMARFNGWTLAACAACSLAGAYWNPGGLVLGAALGLLAWGEFAGARGLLVLDLRAPRRLAFNQIGLAAVIVAYSAFGAVGALREPAVSAAHAAELDSALGPGSAESLARIASTLTVAVYAAVAAGSLLLQGLTAWYYASRGRLVREHLARSPAWAVRVQRIVQAA